MAAAGKINEVLDCFPCVTRGCAYIDGQWIEVPQSFETSDPATEQFISKIASCGPNEIDAAVKAARAALEGPTWGYASTCMQRVGFLRRVTSLLERDSEALARLDALDEGKPLREARADVGDAISLTKHLADLLEAQAAADGESVSVGTDDFTCRVIHEPAGVVAAITPWNYPLLMGAQKTLAALAAGCAVVLKPSELAPMSCLALAALCEEAGLPAGALNVVPGMGAVAGDALSKHPGVDKVSFTGSLATARKVMSAAAMGPRAVSLELGGKSPLLVFADADLPAALDWILMGFVWGSGQVCSSTSRVLVHSSIASKLVQLLVDRLATLPLGASLSEDMLALAGPHIGPVVSRTQYVKIWVSPSS